MGKWLRWLALAPVLLFLLALVVVQTLRAFAIGDAERAALALVDVAPGPVQGTNGFPALALANREVPVAQLDAAMAEEVAAFEQRLAGEALRWDLTAEIELTPDPPAPAATRWPERPAFELDAAYCSLGAADCLATVGAAPDKARALLEGAAGRLERVDLALAADHFRSAYPASHVAPLPPYQLLRLSLVRAALDAMEGRVPDSLARGCRLLEASRRFSGDASDLIGRMVFGAVGEGAANLLLDVRRTYPDVALPAACAQALAPVVTDDYVVCEAMRGEFRWNQSISRQMDAGLAGSWRPADILARWYLIDGRLMEAWTAPEFAHFCTDAFREQLREGIVAPSEFRGITGKDPACYGAYVSCILARIAGGNRAHYQLRLLDHAAKLRLARASLLLSEGSLTREQAIAEARSPGYELTLDEVGGSASIEVRGKPGHGVSRVYLVAF